MKRIGILLALVLFVAACATDQKPVVVSEREGHIDMPASPDNGGIVGDPWVPEQAEKEKERVFEFIVSPESAAFLCQHIRNAISSSGIDSKGYLDKVPGELKKHFDGCVFVSVYGNKAKLFKSAAKDKSIAGAALAAMQKLAIETKGELPEQTSDLPVKVDITETLLPIEMPGAARRAFIPGVDGLWLLPESRAEYRLPSELLPFSPTTSTDIALYFNILPKSDTVRRFRTRAFLQIREDEEPVELTRSLPSAAKVDAESLRERITAACDYLVRSQREDGSYFYLYAAHRDRPGKAEEESMVRHVAVAGIMVLAGEELQRKEFTDSAARCFEFVKGKLRRKDGKAFLLKKGEGTLGGSGLLAWALSNYRRVSGIEKYDQIAREAADFLMAMQKPDGTFYNYYDPLSGEPIDRPARFYQGEACLGLYWYCDVYKDRKYLDAAVRAAGALSQIRSEQISKGSPTLDAWLMQSVRFLYRHADKEQKSVMLGVIEKMANTMVEAQRTAQTASYRDLAGSFRSATQELPSGPGTAAMCEGLAAVYHLLDSLGRPAAKIRDTLINAASFQLKHQFWGANMYYLPNPDKALGGIRATLTNSEIRIDHVQHTVGVWLELLKALE